MESLVPILISCQAFGALIGALAAVWGELSYLRARRGHAIEEEARLLYLHSIARGLRYGMSLLLLASFGLVISAYLLHSISQPARTASYWTLVILALLVTILSWALSRRRISFALGSASIFTAWWFLVYLAIGLLPALSLGSAIALFIIFTGIFYALLTYVHRFSLPHTEGLARRGE